MMKNKIHILILLTILCITTLSCTSKNDRSMSDTTSDSEKQQEKKISEIRSNLITRFNPIIFPPNDFENIRVFTYHLQDLLLSEDDRYILFEGILDDITKENNTYIIHFTSSLSSSFMEDRTVRFHLSSNYEDIKPIIANPKEYDLMLRILSKLNGYKDYFVICQVSDVKKILNYSVQGYSSRGSEEVELEIESPNTFSVTGRLIKLIDYP